VLTELPPRTEIVLPVELSRQEETALYESLRRDALEKLASLEGAAKPEVDPDPGRDDEAAPRLLQSGAGGARAGARQQQAGGVRAPAGRLLENRHKVLVFSQFVDHLS
jgi:SNF2 family DNA or RNA helicase